MALLSVSRAESAQAQSITIDPATSVESTASSYSWNHTVGSGSNRLLIVSVAIENDVNRVTSITYAGQALTFVGTIADADRASRVEVWRLIAPATGTNSVAMTISGGAPESVGAAISFANVDQANPISATQFASGINTVTASATIASATNQLVLAAIAADHTADTLAVGSGQTSQWNRLNGADVIGAGSTKAGAATTAMTYSLQTASDWSMGLLSIRSAPANIVTNTNDSGAGSLRAAIDWANSNPGADTISFAIPGAGPHTITLSSALPALVDAGTVIDGSTQSGAQCRDLWAGAGHDLRINVRGNGGFDGFTTNGANQTIKGLSATNFANAIRALSAGITTTVQCTYLGLLADGTSSGNTRGVWADGASIRIGGSVAGEGNVISANGTAGILTAQGSTDTAIRGNFIGTDAVGMSARPNGTAINHYFGTATWRDLTRNLIAGNSAAIVLEADDQLAPSADTIRIQGNRIGFNRTLSALLLNGTNNPAIQFAPGSITNVLIGGSALTEGNEIAGSREGIVLQQVSNIRIRGNTIARSGMRGIWVEGSSSITIGSSTAGEGNSIGGNGSDGIRLLGNSSGISILGNLIQPITIAGGTFANAEHGIAIDGAGNVTIGDGTAAGRNVIGGNLRRAISGSGANSAITINGNYIGTDATGNVAVANGQNAGSSQKDAISFDGAGTSFTNLAILNNVIGGYAGALIEAWSSTGNGMTIQGNSIGVGANGTSQIVTGNTEDLIYIGGAGGTFSNVLIGGSAAGQGNTIAFSSRSGIRIDTTGSNIQVIGNTIRNNTRNGIYLLGTTRVVVISNRIYANGILGIDLGDNGVTANDAGDGDSGANDLLNFPQLTAVNATGANQLAYNFTLDALAVADGYRVEFFANSAADASGFGEGERYLGHVDIAHAGGIRSFSGTLSTSSPVSIGDVISATTTRRTSGGVWDISSEFSAVATAGGVAALAVEMTSAVFDPPVENAFATPGNDIVLTTQVSNVGTGSTDTNSIFAVISMDAANSFHNATTPAFGGVVGFSSAAPGLTFIPGGDLAFSSSAIAPTSFGQCNYAPQPGYDPQVRHVCINPKGSLPSGMPQGVFTVQLRARIN